MTAKRRSKRKALPHVGPSKVPQENSVGPWLPVVVYAVVTIFLFRKFVFSDQMLFGSDTLSLGYVARAFFAEAVSEKGVFPLWNPRILGGTPFLEALSGGDTLYPTSLLLFIVEPYRALGWKLILHVFASGFFMFGWIRVLGLSRAAAFLAGLSYLVAPFMVTLVLPGHDGKLFVTALTPLMFWAMESSLTRAGLLPFVGIAGVVALVILSTHFQAGYFLFGAAGVYYLFRCVQNGRAGRTGSSPSTESEIEPTGGVGKDLVVPSGPGLRYGLRPAVARFSLFLVAAVLGAGVGGVQLLPSFQYVVEHSRRTVTTTQATSAGEDAVAYSSSWSLHPEEVVSALMVPEFVGNNAGASNWTDYTYWGRNPFKDNSEYVGILALLLAGVSLFGGRRPGVRYFLAGLGLVALLYTLGLHTPVWRLFYEIVPGIKLFRAPSIAIFLVGFSVITLSAFGFDRGMELARKGGKPWRQASWYLWGAAGALGVLAVLASAGILTTLWVSVFYRDLPPQRMEVLLEATPFISRGFWVATALVSMTAGLFWTLSREILKPAGVLAALTLLVAIDGFRVNDSFIQTLDFRRWTAPDATMQYLMERQASGERFRILSLTGNQMLSGQDVRPALFGIELVGGHHPNDLARYRELIGMRGSGSNLFFVDSEGRLRFGFQTMSLLNVRYILWPVARTGVSLSDQLDVAARSTTLGGQVIDELYEIPAQPRAWLVGDAVVVPGPEAVDTLLSDGFDLRRRVVLAEEPPVRLSGSTVSGSVGWMESGFNRIRLAVSSSGPAILVLSENWFPAWQATVNGDEAPVLRANHTLRAVPVPQGLSEVVLEYRSQALKAGLTVSLMSLLVLLVAAVASALAYRVPTGSNGVAARPGRNV